jgi:hypothetical protein
LREHVFGDFNYQQVQQVFAAVNDRFNEIWWFYCSSSATLNDRYVVYNYVEKIWYYGNISRTAWTDSSIVSDLPIAASDSRLLYHETGCDDNSTGSPVAIPAYITSSEFDIDDGHNLGFVWRVLPDLTFRGSTTSTPQATMTLLPLQNSGSGYNNPLSVGGIDSQAVIRGVTIPVETFTGQVNIRVRGRQMSMKISSDGLGVQWQLGAPRIDIRPDGRGNNSNVGALSSWVGSFSGSIASQSFIVDTPYSLDLSTYFVGGLGPFSYGLASGTLPTGLTLNSETGLVSGTATSVGTSSAIVYRRNESFGQYVDSNPITYTVLQAADPYFANVVLLLHGDGANGGTTIADSSSYNHLATVISPGVTTATDGASFAGSAIKTLVSQAAIAFNLSAPISAGEAFTIEGFVQVISQVGVGDGYSDGRGSILRILSGGASGTKDIELSGGIGNAATQLFALPSANEISAPGGSYLNRFYFAITRNAGTTLQLFMNGVLVNSYSSPGGFDCVRIGGAGVVTSRLTSAYIDDLRITKGIARYTTNFTPPTQAFPNY